MPKQRFVAFGGLSRRPAKAGSCNEARIRLVDFSERRQGLGDDSLSVEPGGGVHALRLVLILEGVRQGHRSDLAAAAERSLVAEQRQHMRAEAAPRTLLDRDQQFVLRGEAQNE